MAPLLSTYTHMHYTHTSSQILGTLLCHRLLPQWYKSLPLQKTFWLNICKPSNSFLFVDRKMLKHQRGISSMSNIDKDRERREGEHQSSDTRRRITERKAICVEWLFLFIWMAICLLEDTLAYKMINNLRHRQLYLASETACSSS